MKKLIVVFLICILLLTGCSNNAFKIADTQLGSFESVEVGASTMMFLWQVNKNDIITKWSHDISPEDLPLYWSVKAGEPIGVFVRNATQDKATFSMYYEQPHENFDQYVPAPYYVKDWITLCDNTEIDSGEIWCMPIKIKIGNESDIPNKFWFGTRVERDSSALVRESYIIWWCINMQV